MSTNLQKYSIENQAAVIGVYAQAHDLSIVRTYRDEGESGLKLKNRAGLIQLLDDVQSGRAGFDHILVFDVSRWGRFQDIDESAHYEFLCKQAGITVTYCAEQFPNDGTMLSSIVKNIKRVMAAEWSRDLSGKVHAGACRLSRLGFKIGGRPGYALQRVLVDEMMRPKTILKDGDRKYLMTDHVRLRPGTTDEVNVVRWIFQEFLERRSETSIARELNRSLVGFSEMKTTSETLFITDNHSSSGKRESTTLPNSGLGVKAASNRSSRKRRFLALRKSLMCGALICPNQKCCYA